MWCSCVGRIWKNIKYDLQFIPRDLKEVRFMEEDVLGDMTIRMELTRALNLQFPRVYEFGE